VLVSVDQGRAELDAHGFKRDRSVNDPNCEWWIAPAGYPSLPLTLVGPNKDCFDQDQLSHVLSWKGPYRPGVTLN
jgi:hypothetical protein